MQMSGKTLVCDMEGYFFLTIIRISKINLRHKALDFLCKMLCSTLDIKIIGDELIEYRYAAARNCCKTK